MVKVRQRQWGDRAVKDRVITWGDLASAGRLTLNPNLVKAPPECIDYVLIHALCHLGEPNHGPRFHRLLEALMPQWRSVKERLDGLVEQLMPA